MKMNVENSVNAEMPIPSRAPKGEGVETMHDAPRTGEEIVRTDGNKNRQRRAEMTRPLGSRQIEMQPFGVPVHTSHAILHGIVNVLPSDPRDCEELLNEIEDLPLLVWHSTGSQHTKQPLDIGYALSIPSPLGVADVLNPQGINKVIRSAGVVDAPAKPLVDVQKDRQVVRPKLDGGLGVVSDVSLAISHPRIASDANGAVGCEQAAELGYPKWLNRVAVNVLYHADLHNVGFHSAYHCNLPLPSCQVTDRKDIEDELLSGIGTYVLGEGETARVFRQGFRGMCRGAQVFEDGNITIDSSDDAKGGVFAKEALVLVQGKMPWVKTIRNEKLGGGATEVLHYDEYAYGERSAGNWGYEVRSDATSPTS